MLLHRLAVGGEIGRGGLDGKHLAFSRLDEILLDQGVMIRLRRLQKESPSAGFSAIMRMGKSVPK